MPIKVRLSPGSKIKVKSRIAVSGIDNVNTDGIQDGYVLMYNANQNQYTFVDPDEVLSKATTTNNGLPQDFIDKLDTDLDDRIDLDAGSF